MGNKFIIYADESGNQSLKSIEPEYPVFVLAFCVFDIDDYIYKVVPAFQKLKFDWFGHDMAIFHSSDIRRKRGIFSFLQDANSYDRFHSDLRNFILESPFKIAHSAIDRRKIGANETAVDLYELAAREAISKVNLYLSYQGEDLDSTCLVFESRGPHQDKLLNSQLERLGWQGRAKYASKLSISTGLQIADLVARPIGMTLVSPNAGNRPFEVIESKLLA
jgi:hypothetical protein